MAESMFGLTQYTPVGTHNPHQDFQTEPLNSYGHKNHKTTGVERYKYIQNSYLRMPTGMTVLMDFLLLIPLVFICIIIAYWPAQIIMQEFGLGQLMYNGGLSGAMNGDNYDFPICLPFLPICPTGQLSPCGVDATNWFYNPDCKCYTSLLSLAVALWMTVLWGHWWFWISKKVIFEQTESTTTAAMVYTEIEQSQVNQNAPYNGGAMGPRRWFSQFLY